MIGALAGCGDAKDRATIRPVATITEKAEEAQLDITPSGNGDYAVEGYVVGEVGAATRFTGTNCFAGNAEDVIPDDPDTQIRRLNRIPLGGRVNVSLRPLTPSPKTGRMILGRSYDFRPPLRTARHLLSAGQINDRDRKQLQTIGCG